MVPTAARVVCPLVCLLLQKIEIQFPVQIHIGDDARPSAAMTPKDVDLAGFFVALTYLYRGPTSLQCSGYFSGLAGKRSFFFPSENKRIFWDIFFLEKCHDLFPLSLLFILSKSVKVSNLATAIDRI